MPMSRKTQRAAGRELETLNANALIAAAGLDAQFRIAAIREALQHQLDLLREDHRAALVDRKMLNTVLIEKKLAALAEVAPGALPDLDKIRAAYVTRSVLDLLEG
jgi:hypothetical protein